MISTRSRRALVALAATAALLPAAPALAQTATTTVTTAPSPAPEPASIDVSRNVIDYGQTILLGARGRFGAPVQLFGNGKLIRTATIGEDGEAGPVFTWELRPGDRTLFYALIDGQRTETITVEVRRTVTIGVSQARGVYSFTGTTRRAEPGLQVTIARLDATTKRVTGVASALTNAAGNYTIRTALPASQAGYYALTGVTRNGALQPGRSRLYGLVVPVQSDPREREDVAAGS